MLLLHLWCMSFIIRSLVCEWLPQKLYTSRTIPQQACPANNNVLGRLSIRCTPYINDNRDCKQDNVKFYQLYTITAGHDSGYTVSKQQSGISLCEYLSCKGTTFKYCRSISQTVMLLYVESFFSEHRQWVVNLYLYFNFQLFLTTNYCVNMLNMVILWRRLTFYMVIIGVTFFMDARVDLFLYC